MEIYKKLLEAVNCDYDTVKILKESERGRVTVICHKATRKRYIFRQFEGNSEVYRRLLRISCPYLPQIMEVGESDGKSIVLEEYIYGDTLSFILEGGLLTPQEAKRVMMQICTALYALHSMGAVHRDIKPENIVIRGNEAVLIDFDASRIFKTENEADTQILGTTGFAAPEQYGLAQSDERADIYALGVLLNLMLTGKHPSRELAAGKMGHIVQRCTMMHPKKRFKNVVHLMEVL